MSQLSYIFALLIIILVSSYAVEINSNSNGSGIQPQGVINPAPICNAVGSFKQFEVTNCTKFPCDITNATTFNLTFTPSRDAYADVRVTLYPSCGGTQGLFSTDLGHIFLEEQVVTLGGFGYYTTISDGEYTMRIEVLTRDAPIQTQACVQGTVNWKTNGHEVPKCGSSGLSPGSILAVALVASIWKIVI
jgi:hypothetical protein